LFSGKVTACISPMISIYLVNAIFNLFLVIILFYFFVFIKKGKIYPTLPALIYGIISVLCGFISLYVPETLNRPLPNSIEDVLKWPRTLTAEEWKAVNELNSKEFNMKKIKKCLRNNLCCNKQSKTDEKKISLNNNNDMICLENKTLTKSASTVLNLANESNNLINNNNTCNLPATQSSLLSSSASAYFINKKSSDDTR
jgi:hypothetical protein